MQYHARSCNIMLSSCIEYVLSMWLENLRRRLSIHFLQHLGGFLHPGDLNVSGVATQRHGKHGGAAAARPRICAPCRWPPASDLSFEKIWLTYYVLLCIIIWSSYDLLCDYIICDWFCSVVYDLISFENCWGAQVSRDSAESLINCKGISKHLRRVRRMSIWVHLPLLVQFRLQRGKFGKHFLATNNSWGDKGGEMAKWWKIPQGPQKLRPETPSAPLKYQW